MKTKILLLSLMLFSNLSKAQYFDTLAYNNTNLGVISLAMNNVTEFRVTSDTTIHLLARGVLLKHKGSFSYQTISGFYTELEVSGDTVWVGGYDSLMQIVNGIRTRMPMSVNDMAVDQHVLYVAGNDGIKSYDGFTWTSVPSSVMGLSNDTIKLIARSSYGIYVMDAQGNIAVRHNGNWSLILHPPFLRLPSRMTSSNSKIYLSRVNAVIEDNNLYSYSFKVDPCVIKDKINYSGNVIPYPSSGNDVLIFSYFPFDTTNQGYYSDTTYYYTISNHNLDQSAIRFVTDTLSMTLGSTIIYPNRFIIDEQDNLYIIKPRYGGQNCVLRLKNLHQNTYYPATTDCPYLDINNVRARCSNDGIMFWDEVSSALYEVPKNSGKTVLFGNGMWIGGLDPGNNLHLAAQTYRQSGKDYWPGPLDTINGSIDSATSQRYDQLWKIDRSTINDFLYHFNNGDVQSGAYTIPDIIMNWPAHGTGNMSHTLAPFRDVNNDGIYNPMDGDFPYIKGSQMIWNVFNDNLDEHAESGGKKLGLEIHQSSYAFNCPNATGPDSALNYTTYYHYDIYNRSDTTYHNVYVALFTDVDLGNYYDDYVGCDTINNYAFGFNGDNFDDGIWSYGENPPMINLLTLKGPVADANDGIDNDRDGTTDEPSECLYMTNFIYYNNDFTPIGNPVIPNDYYNYMSGFWKDSVPLTYGGKGRNPGSTDYTKFMFTGIPYSGNMWTEQNPSASEPANEPQDRRFVSSSGPFTLAAHEKRSIDFAYVYTRDPNNPNGLNTSIAVNQQQVLRIKQLFESGIYPCDNIISVNDPEPVQFSIYPNPGNGLFTLTFKNDLTKTISVKNTLGQEVISDKSIKDKNTMMDLSSLSRGIYFISVLQNGSSYTEKLIIQ